MKLALAIIVFLLLLGLAPAFVHAEGHDLVPQLHHRRPLPTAADSCAPTTTCSGAATVKRAAPGA